MGVLPEHGHLTGDERTTFYPHTSDKVKEKILQLADVTGKYSDFLSK